MIEPRTDIISKDKPQPDKDLRGKVKCLKCQKDFKSPDKTKIRFCPKCRGNRGGSDGWMERRYGWMT